MRWLRRAPKQAKPGTTPEQDLAAARLTARADLILEELDGVVKEMSAMLRKKAAGND